MNQPVSQEKPEEQEGLSSGNHTETNEKKKDRVHSAADDASMGVPDRGLYGW